MSNDVCVCYHGTSLEMANSIYENGFKIKYKKDGANKALQNATALIDKTAACFHYVSTSKKEAAGYAKIHKNPKIVKVICLKNWLENDTESVTQTAFRIRKDISRKFIIKDECNIDRFLNKVERKINFKLTKSERDNIKRQAGDLQEDKLILRDAVSPVTEEQACDKKRLQVLDKMVGLDNLQEGQVYTLDPDELDGL